MNKQSSQYIPGVCNIGPAEIARRKKVGYAGTALTILMWVIFAAINLSRFWRLILFFPASLAGVGFIQARLHFCANFGLRGVFNLSSNAYKHDTVMEAEFRKQDRRKAIEIIAYSVIAGILVALAAYYL